MSTEDIIACLQSRLEELSQEQARIRTALTALNGRASHVVSESIKATTTASKSKSRKRKLVYGGVSEDRIAAVGELFARSSTPLTTSEIATKQKVAYTTATFAVRALADRGLITQAGRKETAGHPVLWAPRPGAALLREGKSGR